MHFFSLVTLVATAAVVAAMPMSLLMGEHDENLARLFNLDDGYERFAWQPEVEKRFSRFGGAYLESEEGDAEDSMEKRSAAARARTSSFAGGSGGDKIVVVSGGDNFGSSRSKQPFLVKN